MNQVRTKNSQSEIKETAKTEISNPLKRDPNAQKKLDFLNERIYQEFLNMKTDLGILGRP